MHGKLAVRCDKDLLLTLSALFILSMLPASVAGQTTGACPSNLTGYKVTAIKVHTSFGFSDAAKKLIDDTVNSADGGLRVNGPFSTDAEAATVRALQMLATPKSRTAQVHGPLVLPSVVFPPEIKACDTTAKTLEAHFYVYTVDYQTYLSSLFSAGQEDVRRAAPSTPLTRFIAATNPQPLVGFNRSRGVFGGGSARANFGNPIVREVGVSASGSSSSAEAAADIQGSRELDNKLLGHAEWKIGFDYSNVPSTLNDLKGGTGYGQFIGATRPVSKLGLVARYGASFEAGNRQSDLDPRLAPPGILTSSRYTSAKLFAGGVAQTRRHSFDISYGLEVGNAKEGLSVDYLKHVFDTGYSARFYPFSHKPITLDARFTAGTLTRRGNVPLATRFFGGDVEKNFISSDDWVIRSNPYIRSFPQNRFLPAGQTFATGGDKFASFNLTAGATLWSHPLVSDKLNISDADIDNALIFPKAFLADQLFIEKAAPLRKFAADTLKLTPVITSLRDTLSSLNGTFPAGSDAEATYHDTVEDVCNAWFDLNEVALAMEDPSAVQEVCNKDAVNDGRALAWLDSLMFSSKAGSNPPIRPTLHNLSCDLFLLADELKRVGASADKIAAVEQAGQAVENVRKTACVYACLKGGSTDPVRYDVGLDLASCAASSEDGTGPLCPGPCSSYVSAQDAAAMTTASQEAQRKADEIIEYSGSLMKRLVRDENLIALGPVFMLDAARIAERPNSLSSAPTRYGVGVGGRLSLVSLDVTFGYSFNTKRRVNEPRGAFVFSINVTDLLK